MRWACGLVAVLALLGCPPSLGPDPGPPVDEDLSGLPPGQWTSDDAFSVVLDADDEWRTLRVQESRVRNLISPVVGALAYRYDGSFVQEAGIGVFEVPGCPGPHDQATSQSFILEAVGANYLQAGPMVDFDGNGVADVVLQNRVYLGPFSGDRGPLDQDVSLPFVPDGLDLHDIDGDGERDLVASSAGGTVAFWPGPITGTSLSLDDATVIGLPTSGVFFGETMAVLPVPGGEPITLIGAPRQPPYGRVHYVEGWPEPGQTEPDGELDLSVWQGQTDATFWGGVIASDGESRACIGHGLSGPAPVLCGTWAELQAGSPAIEIPTGGISDGNYVDMTPRLVAQGHYSYLGAWSDDGIIGRLHVRGPAGEAWEIDCASYEGCAGAFGKGLALLPDPARPNITWLAASGAFSVYFFALDTSGL